MNVQSGSRIRHNDPAILFTFNSVVVVGASEDANRIGGAPLELLKKYGYKGKVYGINPKYKTVQGFPCVASADDLPENVDVAIFSVAVDSIRTIMPALVRKGLKAAVIFTAGFREAGEAGRAAQEWLTQYARENCVAVVGPNCVGQISFANQRSLTFANAVRVLPVVQPGRVALLSQSGGVATNIWADGLLSGTRFSHLITTGNEADLGFTQFLDYLADDKDTDVVLGYIEALDDGLAFCRAAEKMRQAGKPLIVIKVGVSAAGQDVVASHTGQLSSDDSAYQAAFDRYGVIRVKTLQDLNDHARIFSLKGLRPKITAATTSGGAGVYVADLCTELGIELSKLSPDTEKKLSAIIPSYGRLQNPVDLTAQVVNDMGILENSLQILLNDPETGILLFMLSGKGTPEQSAQVIKLFKGLQEKTDKTLVICWLGVPEPVRMNATEHGLIVYQDPGRFLRPLGAYFETYGRFAGGRTAEQLANFLSFAVNAADPSEVRSRMEARDGRKILSEAASLELLMEAGVDCPQRSFASSVDEVDKIAKTMSLPCVMKIVDPFIAHKSDAGGVVVNIDSPAKLMAAWQLMAQRLNASKVMIAEQIERGVEILVGCQRDRAFGMRLTIGTGGIWTNFAHDAANLVPPFTEESIREALQRLTIWAQLSGQRGQQSMAVDRLVETIGKIAACAWSWRDELKEFECNPVIVTRDRAVAVDAIGFA